MRCGAVLQPQVARPARRRLPQRHWQEKRCEAARAPAWRTPCKRGTPGEARRRSPPRPQRRPNRAACRTTRACCRRSRRTSVRCGLERTGGRRRTASVSAALRSAGSRRSAAAGSRAPALACAEIAGAKSERAHWEKGLGRDILATCERNGGAFQWDTESQSQILIHSDCCQHSGGGGTSACGGVAERERGFGSDFYESET
jgi:hypothetical protein